MSLLALVPLFTPRHPLRWWGRLVAWFGAMVLAGCASGPPALQPVARGDLAEVQRQLQALVAQQLQAHQVAGLSLALVDRDRVVWAHAQGLADRATGRPATPDTRYRMGSVSKLFTDTAAMQLVAQGKLALDAPITAVLPWFRRSGSGSATGNGPGTGAGNDAGPQQPITLRQLMSHHSGLPRDRLAGMWGTRVGDFRDTLRALADEPAMAPPNLLFSYSNQGLNLVGAAVEQAAGRPFEQQMQQAVLQPLGMRRAEFSASLPSADDTARGHQRGQPRDEPALRDVPAGGLTASVLDVARLLTMQFARGRHAEGAVVLPEAQWAEMLRPQNTGVPLDGDLRIGLGWFLGHPGDAAQWGGGPVAQHGGATFYFRSQVMWLPEAGLGVVVAANDAAASPVVNLVAQRALALLLAQRTGARAPEPAPGFQPAATRWSAAQRAQAQRDCTGEWITLNGLAEVTATAPGAGLRANLGGQQFELQEGEQGRLGLRLRLGGWLPVPMVGPFAALGRLGLSCTRLAGRDLLLAHPGDATLVAGERLPPAAPLPPEVLAALGRYEPQLAEGEVATLKSATLQQAKGRLWVVIELDPVFGASTHVALLRLEAPDQARMVGPLADIGPVLRWVQRPGEAPEVHTSGWILRRADKP